MGLIKSNHAPAALSPFSMRDIEAQARQIILRAQQQAEQVLAEAQQQAGQIRQRAYDQGFAAGREDGLKSGAQEGRSAGQQAALAEHRARLEQLIKALSAAASELDASRRRLQADATAELIRLAVAIARRVTKLQGALDPSVLTANVTEAIRLVVQSSDVRIAVHPSQKQVLAEVLPALKVQWPQLQHVELVEDATLLPGGCRIFTASGEIDADLDRQIDRVAADLLPAASAGTEAPES
ncbi:FliH/SctL family protein [Fontivita pretiosa]|uniref:FliH/SctL family protein n=1 Tax=Fontivita pretiosa TaxID=2989684 RepID=UPI003D177CAB